MLRSHGLEATFFIETAHTRYFGKKAMAGYAERLIAAGQDVQLHLHPMWLNYENGAMKPDQTVSDHCYDLDIEPLTELLLDGGDPGDEWTGRRPQIRRASWRERGCEDGSVWVGGVSLKKKINT